MHLGNKLNKVAIRKNIATCNKLMKNADTESKYYYITNIQIKKDILKIADKLETLPNLGKLRLVLEQELKNEEADLDSKVSPSENDLKRWALKSAVYDYYMNLPYDLETVAVDYVGDLTARRDDKDVDNSDVDLAPNKNKIYNIWMEKLAKLIRDKKISQYEFDEAAERGTPQGGAFEKQLLRFRTEFMKKLWDDYTKFYK